MALCSASVEPEFMKTVGSQFSDGVDALEEFVAVLENTYVPPSMTTSEANDLVKLISPSISRAYKEFSLARDSSDRFNVMVNKEVEEGVAKQSDLQRQIRNIESEERSLSQRLNAIRDSISETETQVRCAKENLGRAERTLQEARDKVEEKTRDRDVVRGVGVGLAFIPVAGWIVGGTMLAVSETVLTEAVETAESAKNSAFGNVQDCEGSLKRHKQEKRSLEENLHSKQNKRKQMQSDLQCKEESLKVIKNAQKRATQMSQDWKQCTAIIAKTCGQTKVLHGEICGQDFYTLETLQEPLEAIASHFQSVSKKNWLLSSSFRSTLCSASEKFKMICDRSTQPVFEELHLWC